VVWQRWNTHAEIKNKYLPRILGKEPASCYLILFDEIKIGYIQTYFVCDYPEYNKYVKMSNDVAGIDIFIGEEDYIHKGHGGIFIKKFLKYIVFKDDDVKTCIVGPDPKNIAAIKAYEKVGFKYIKTIKIPNEEEAKFIMEIKRDEINKNGVRANCT
jgi:RimJ/RimL family protein N-acetyltransferase